MVSMAGAGRWRRALGWRLRLTLAGAALGLLPLFEGEWLAAALAAVGGGLVAGTWAHACSGGRSAAVAVGTGIVVLFGGAFAVSQWPTGVIRAPWLDWFAVWILVGCGCSVALIVDWCVHQRGGIVHMGVFGTMRLPNAIGLMTLLTAVPLLFLCCAGFHLNDAALRSAPGTNEILPLPSTLRLVSAGPCLRGGSSSGCTADFVVSPTDGAGREVTVARLADHLHRRGWPLQAANSSYDGCRPVGGILSWTPHCMSLYPDPVPWRPTPTGAVVVSISNLD
jgi:hypothetical protein